MPTTKQAHAETNRQPMHHASCHTIDLDCGIATQRIVTWLEDELALPALDDGWEFSIGQSTCTVAAQPLEARSLGAVRLKRTRLIASGDEEALEEFSKLFTLRFISAGG